MTRVALYARVSTDEQAEKYGLAAQLHELRQHAADGGHQVVGEFVDDGYSGADLGRPALARLRQGVRDRAFDLILVHDPDRLARRLAHQMILVDEIEGAGVHLVFLTTPREQTPVGKMFFEFKGLIAEYEREVIRERTERGRKEKARRGLMVTGQAPYGYRVVDDRLEILEEEAAVVRMIFRWAVEGPRSLWSIVRELRGLGIRTRAGQPWGRSSLNKMLNNETYVGRTWYNRRRFEPLPGAGKGKRRATVRLKPREEWIPIPCPPLVTPEDFERVRQRMQANRELFRGRPGRFYLLRGLLWCGRCARRWWSKPIRGQRFYFCSGGLPRTRGLHCSAGHLAADRLETCVWDTVVGILRNPDVLHAQLETHRVQLGVLEVELRSEVEHLRRQLATARTQEQRLLDLYLADGVPTEAVAERLRELKARREALASRLEEASLQATQHQVEEADQERLRRYCADALRGLDTMGEQERRALLVALVARVVVDGDSVEIHGVLQADPAASPRRAVVMATLTGR